VPHHAVRLNPVPNWQRRAGYVVLLALLLSGLTWLAVHFLHWPAASRSAMEGLPSPWEAGLMRVHGAAAMVALFVFGALTSTHVIRGWRMKRRLPSGMVVLGCAVLLVLSAYGLYYLVPDDWRDGLGLLHAGTGISVTLALLWHRRRRRSA
jgi:hypothetical protein